MDSIYVLVQARSSAPWKAVASISDMPGISGGPETPVLDSAGYATAVSGRQQASGRRPWPAGLALPAATHSGSGHPFHLPLSNVALTPSGNPVSQASSRKLGWQVSIMWVPYMQAPYALAAPGGGAVVIFAEEQRYSWTAISAQAQLRSTDDPAVGSHFYAPWPQFASLSHVTSVREGQRISLETIYDWLAVDPPAHSPGGVLLLPISDDGFAGVSAN
jgi:hypothetical protein